MILLFGSYGQLGMAFKDLFNEEKIDYKAIDKDDFDICDLNITQKFIENLDKENKIDVIINCTAYNDVDMAEENKNDCYKLNMEVPAMLANISMNIGAKFLTFSTDFVFDTGISNYINIDNLGFSEEDETSPKSIYAKSKNEGELLISNLFDISLSKIYIVRTSWLFGFGEKDNFIDKILNASKNSEIKVVEDQISTPTYTKDLAFISYKLLKSEKDSGIYHICNDGYAKKSDFAKYILKKINWQGNFISIKTEDLHEKAKRPYFSKLNCNKIKEILNISIPYWTDAVDRYLEEKLK